MSEVKILFWFCLFCYVVGVVLSTLSTWYKHKMDYKYIRYSTTLYILSGFIFIGVVLYGFLYGMLLTYDLWK